MMRWWKNRAKNHKGYSLVELICTIAIFSIVIMGVGTAMVVSARNYQNGSVELDLQQQAQITSNLLTNLVIDSDRVVEASGSRLVLEKVESGVSVTYEIQLESDGNGGHKITYTSNAGSGTLAENVDASGFTVSQDDGGNVDFTLKFLEGTREYESVYHVTPRNGVTSGGTATTGKASIFVENEIVLEPGETYDLNVRILGTSEQDFSVQGPEGHTDTTGTNVIKQGGNTVHITVGLGETSEEFHFKIIPQDASIPIQDVTVRVRRVNAINVNGYKTDGTVNKSGASYKVTAPLAGSHLERMPGAWYDVNYVDPYVVNWSFKFTREDEYGHITMPNAMDYIEITGQGMDGNIPYVTFVLKQNMTEGCSLEVTGTALHPEGKYPVDSSNQTNKSGLKYGTVNGSWVLEYQAWRRNGKLDIAVGEKSPGNYWISENGKKHYAYSASVSFTAYNYFGDVLDGSANTMNSWTASTDGLLDAIVDENDIMSTWQLVLNPERPNSSSPNRRHLSYSTPYVTAYTERDYGAVWAGVPYELYRYVYVGYNDPYRFVIKIDYQEILEDGTMVSRSIEEEHTIEDVSIKYKNSEVDDWRRDNTIFVTEADSMTQYKVYFMFDRGWEGTNYYFHDAGRFVGVVHEDQNDLYDIRRDIEVLCPKAEEYGGGTSYIVFTLSADDKRECLELSKNDNGIIKEIFEYNPLFGRLIKQPIIESNPATGMNELKGYKWPDYSPYPYGADKSRLDQVKGCKGTVIFCFKTPNVTVPDGITPLKAMYCPTIAENSGNQFYYIDDTTRYNLLGEEGPQYQEWNGSAWITTYQLVSNSTGGWTVN